MLNFSIFFSLSQPSSPSLQLCALVIADDGLTLRWEDESKAMQASIFLAPALFSQYDVPWATRATGVRLHPLADALLVFTSGSGGGSGGGGAAPSSSDLVLTSPGAGGGAALELGAVEGGGAGGALCVATAALLDGADPPTSRDLAEGWAGPAASLVAPASLLKEAVEDLEWGAAAGRGTARLTLSSGGGGGGRAHQQQQRLGPRAALSAGPGPGGEVVAVDLPVASLSEFRLDPALAGAGGTVSHAYPYRLLRAALGAGAGKGGGGLLGGGGGGGGWGGGGDGGGAHHHPASSSGGATTTKLAIDARGVLVVTHLVPVDGGGGGGEHSATNAVIKFVVVSSVEEDGEGGGGDVYRGPTSGAAG